MLGIDEDKTPQASDSGWIGPAPWIQTPLPGPNAEAMIARDHRVSSPSYSRNYPLVIRRGSGSVIEDVDGNRFLDLAAGIAVCATGHCHSKVVAAIREQSESLLHACGSAFYYAPMIELMERLAEIAPGDRPKRVFLTNSGTEAIEAAFKLARYHTRRKWVIAFHGAFHGRTMGALSLTCSKGRHQEGFGPLVPMVAHVPYGDVDAIESQLFKRQMSPREVAAIFVEPTQGEGGYIVPEPEFLPRLRALCDKHRILLVCDEIQTGMGRTGKWFACEHFGVVPDIIVLAKGIASGLPLGAIVTRADLMNWRSGAHASTMGGNPVSCAAALATIELIESTYMANAARLGKQLLATLQEIAGKRKSVTGARGLGLMCAIDIVNRTSGKLDAKARSRIAGEAFQRGLIVLPCGEASIRFSPPLCINETQLDVGLKLFDEDIATVI
jgi:4-aminobutyrate aminotransferase